MQTQSHMNTVISSLLLGGDHCKIMSAFVLTLLILLLFTELASEIQVLMELFCRLCRFPGIPQELQEENGIQYKFEVYESVEQ